MMILSRLIVTVIIETLFIATLFADDEGQTNTADIIKRALSISNTSSRNSAAWFSSWDDYRYSIAVGWKDRTKIDNIDLILVNRSGQFGVPYLSITMDNNCKKWLVGNLTPPSKTWPWRAAEHSITKTVTAKLADLIEPILLAANADGLILDKWWILSNGDPSSTGRIIVVAIDSSKRRGRLNSSDLTHLNSSKLPRLKIQHIQDLTSFRDKLLVASYEAESIVAVGTRGLVITGSSIVSISLGPKHSALKPLLIRVAIPNTNEFIHIKAQKLIPPPSFTASTEEIADAIAEGIHPHSTLGQDPVLWILSAP